MAMLARFNSFINRLKSKFKREEAEEKEEGVGVPPEEEIVTADVHDRRNKVAEFLEPVNKNWEFIQDVLLWKNAMPACVCFFLISGVFWKFINIKLRKVVLFLGAFLLATGLSSEIRASSWQFFETNFHLQAKGEAKLQFNFDDLCLYIATGWAMASQAHGTMKNLSTDCPPKFYCLIAVTLFTILAMFTYLPVLEFIYVTVCAVFFYPSMYHYGILDLINSRIDRLTMPIVRHWKNNRTKRKRVVERPGVDKQREETYDSDDEFSLDKNQFTSKVLSSAVHGGEIENETDDDVLPKEVPGYEGDYLTESHLEENLAMPSMSNFDSLMEPYDDFHAGLNFPDYQDSSQMHTYNVLVAAANNIDTDEEIDDLPYENETFPTRNNDSQGITEKHVLNQKTDEEDFHSQNSHASFEMNFVERELNKKRNKNISTEECTRAVEADFEFLEHADVDDPNYAKSLSHQREVRKDKLESYTDSGIATVSKWLGYQ